MTNNIEALNQALNVSVETETNSDSTDGRSKPKKAYWPQPVDEKGKAIPFESPVELPGLICPVSGLPWAVFKESQFRDPADCIESQIHHLRLKVKEKEEELEKLLAMGETFEERQAAMAQLRDLDKVTSLIAKLQSAGVPLDQIQAVLGRHIGS